MVHRFTLWFCACALGSAGCASMAPAFEAPLYEQAADYDDAKPGWRSGEAAPGASPAAGAPAKLEQSVELAGILAGTGSREGLPDSESTPSEAEAPAPATKRLVIYTGTVHVLVANPETARVKFLEQIEALGGYLQNQENDVVTVRVPAARFHETVESLVDFGAITHRAIQTDDVTKRVFELGLRIDNAEKSRQRLLALLSQATEMKDILAIEQELRRLTDEIELLKGEMRTLRDRIALSTLTVRFLSDAPPPRPRRAREASEFEWINQVGAEHALVQF